VICVTYYDTLKHKPNPEPYLLAEQQFRHDNINIFCIGDQLTDIIACDNAGKRDRHHNYVPALAFWNQGWRIQQQHSRDKFKVFYSEVDLIDFLGFIMPANQSLASLIRNYLRPTFIDLSWTDEQYYMVLQEASCIDEENKITDVGKHLGLSYSMGSNPNKYSKIFCDYRATSFIIGWICQL